MKEIEFHTMQDYCENIKKYIDFYHKDESNIELYGDVKNELITLMTTTTPIEEFEFSTRIQELIGKTIRILQGSYSDIPMLRMIGNEESFTKNHFKNTMKNVWSELTN